MYFDPIQTPARGIVVANGAVQIEMVNLYPADMPAVLERTNLKPNFENFLLPIYEAISNAIYATQSRFGDEASRDGHVVVDIKTANFRATISDNGLGLEQVNYNHFLTPFTGSRLKRGGKGFGRFIAFKVFNRIFYSSRYIDADGTHERRFIFNIYADPQICTDDKLPHHSMEGPGCSVFYESPNDDFVGVISNIDGSDIVERIIRYFLPFFLSPNMPTLTVNVDGAKFDAKSHFKEFFSPEVQRDIEIDFDGILEKFSVSISRVKRESLFKEHIALLFADGRIIGGGRPISQVIGNKHFVDQNGEKKIYIASISGDLLNRRANNARTEIDASKEEIDSIVKPVTDIILERENEFVQQHRKTQSKTVALGIMRNPLLRSALKGRSIEEYVKNKPMGWGVENFVSDLALTRLRDQKNWQKEFDEGLKKPEKLIEKRDRIFTQLDEENKDALAAYVAHRHSVLELTEAVLGYQEDGNMSLEDMFHDIVHPRYADSDNTKFYQHNLWLLDERLAFFSYCSSDRTLHGGRRKTGDKVGDLVLFEDCTVHNSANNDCVVLVEFKRPGRNNYKFGDAKHDPIQQVLETAVLIRDTGRIITTKGRTVSVPNSSRIFAYIVADLEPTLREVCENHDFHETWDGLGYFRYHEKRDIFIELNTFDKVLTDAKKRNAAFFEILLGELTVQS